MREREFAAKVDALAQPPKPPEPAKPNPEPIRFLALLQRDGRLLDFLLEDVSAATDMDLGAGVREIHRQCQKALKDHLDPLSFTIATFALCGFANISSVGIQIGGIGALAPERKQDLARLGFRAMIAGTLANFLSATLAGILL